MTKPVTLLLLPFLVSSAIAQEVDEQQVEIRSYTVEMIIFRYAQSVSSGSEIFLPDAPPAEDILPENAELHEVSLQVRDSEVDDILAQLARNREGKPYELVMLAEEDFMLLEAFDHLRRLDAYEPLLHFGWTQSTYPDEDVESRPLSSFTTLPDGLEGNLRLYLSRYLHLAINLQLDAPIENDTAGDGYYGFTEDQAISYPTRYRIDEDRIFRNGELRYFDHPRFGVLAKVTRVQEQQAQEDEFFDDREMLGD